MTKRRLIRTLFLLPILLCLAGWAWGATHFTYLQYSHDRRYAGCDLSYGVFTVIVGRDVSMLDGWEFENDPLPGTQSWPPDTQDYQFFLGFGIGHGADSVARWHGVAVPYWSLLLLSTALFLLIYRKTRPNPHPPTAFPIEPVKPHDQTPTPPPSPSPGPSRGPSP